jgi:hypothetical protein
VPCDDDPATVGYRCSSGMTKPNANWTCCSRNSVTAHRQTAPSNTSCITDPAADLSSPSSSDCAYAGTAGCRFGPCIQRWPRLRSGSPMPQMNSITIVCDSVGRKVPSGVGFHRRRSRHHLASGPATTDYAVDDVDGPACLRSVHYVCATAEDTSPRIAPPSHSLPIDRCLGVRILT